LTSWATTAKPRQQIGLLGDRGDQFRDVADAVRRVGQFGDPGVGLLRLNDRLAGDPVGVRDLSADFIDGAGHFLRG
jgi:hypothetical protein